MKSCTRPWLLKFIGTDLYRNINYTEIDGKWEYSHYRKSLFLPWDALGRDRESEALTQE
ncbi:MAG: hypothetical protein ACRCT1_12185 [Microcoleaceae cyanobacterium]|jgi:hypothetical protein